jgi:uncharacterized protein with GYD domain
MAKYLVRASYTAEGTKGLLKDGGSKRRAIVEKFIAGAGGKLESFYFAFGADDAILIVDLPDASAAVAVSLAVGSTGAVKLSTTPLITPEEVDAAAKRTVQYVAPGA